MICQATTTTMSLVVVVVLLLSLSIVLGQVQQKQRTDTAVTSAQIVDIDLLLPSSHPPTRQQYQGQQDHQNRQLQILPKVRRRRRSYYVVDWLFARATNCDPHLMSVDMECRNGTPTVITSTNATCINLTGQDGGGNEEKGGEGDWIRCTSTTETSAASVQVKCTSNGAVQGLALLAKSVPFAVTCYEASSPSIFMLINRLCPSSSSASTTENDKDDNAETIEGYTVVDVPFRCINASPILEENGEGVCESTEYVSCVIANNEYGPFYACGQFNRFAVLAFVPYSSIDDDDGACLFDAEEEDAEITSQASENNIQQTLMWPPTLFSGAPHTTASTQEGDTKEATYHIYFDTKKNETTTTSVDCIFPAPSIYLICGSGKAPTVKDVKSTSCYGVWTTTPDDNNDGDHIEMYRCMKVASGDSGSVTASCTGNSEAARELFVYMDEQSLPQCENTSTVSTSAAVEQHDIVANYIWMSAICDGELVWGEKAKCLQATDSYISVSDDGVPFDTCKSSYTCNDDGGGGESSPSSSCTGQEMIVSASMDDALCLEDATDSSSQAAINFDIEDEQIPADMENIATSGGFAVPCAAGEALLLAASFITMFSL